MTPDPLAARFGRDFRAGDVIFREGDAGAVMYVIQQGRVRISRRFATGERTVATLGAGDFFGEMAILNEKPRAATAVAVDAVRAMELDARTLEGMVERSGEVAMRLIRRLARRLDSANAFIEILLQSDPRARVILGIARAAEESGARGADGVRVSGDVHALARELGLSVEAVTEVVARLLRVRVLRADDDGRWVIPDPQRLREFVELVGADTPRKD
jgi:CRP-like cAMP-binding protein